MFINWLHFLTSPTLINSRKMWFQKKRLLFTFNQFLLVVMVVVVSFLSAIYRKQHQRNILQFEDSLVLPSPTSGSSMRKQLLVHCWIQFSTTKIIALNIPPAWCSAHHCQSRGYENGINCKSQKAKQRMSAGVKQDKIKTRIQCQTRKQTMVSCGRDKDYTTTNQQKYIHYNKTINDVDITTQQLDSTKHTYHQ